MINQNSDGLCELIHVTSRYDSVSSTPLYLHRISDNHYNGVSKVKPSRPRLAYSRDDLLKLKLPGTIPRDTRKILFRNNIWQPGQVDQANAESGNKSHKIQQGQNTEFLKGGILNPWSACNKSLLIRDHVLDENCDFLALTETYQINDAVERELLPPGYDLVYNPRTLGDKSKGGGVAFIYRSSVIKCNVVKRYNFKSFEGFHLRVTLPHVILNVVVIYAPEPKTSSASHELFLAEFGPVLLDELHRYVNVKNSKF